MTAAILLLSITLAWDLPDMDLSKVKGYEICWGYESRQYGRCEIAHGADTKKHTIEEIDLGHLTFFAARTLGVCGGKSEFSNEVTHSKGSSPGEGAGCFLLNL